MNYHFSSKLTKKMADNRSCLSSPSLNLAAKFQSLTPPIAKSKTLHPDSCKTDLTLLLSDLTLLTIIKKVPKPHRKNLSLVCKRWLKIHGRPVRSIKVSDWEFLASARMISRLPNLDTVDLGLTRVRVSLRSITKLLFSISSKSRLCDSGGIPHGSYQIARTGTLLSRWISSVSSSAAVVTDDESGGIYGLGSVLKEYEDYRRSLYGEITHKALLVDAVGTLLVPAQPTTQIYKNIGEKYRVEYSEAETLTRNRRAYQKPWGGSHLRYVNDARPFWQYIVSASTGCSDSQYFEELYSYFTIEQAWKLCDPEAEKVFKAIKEAGVKVAIVSNFDTQLRPLLRALRCEDWFDVVAVSAEDEAEKPNPTIFLKACELLGVNPEEAVHVGDDRRNDVWGARDAGCDGYKDLEYRV